MSRKFRKTVASTLALAMMAGSISSMPAVQLSSIVQAAVTGATVTVNSETKTVKPGDTFTVTCDVTDNAEGFNALLAWLTYNQKAFEMVKWENGARDDDDNVYNCVSDPFASGQESQYVNPDANLKTIIQMYFDTSAKNYIGDCTISKVTFKVLDNAAPGEYEFTVSGDPELGENGQKKDAQNRVVAGQKDPLVCEPVYKALKVTVASESAPTDKPTEAPTDKPTEAPTDKPTETPTEKPTENPTTAPTTDPIPADAIIIEIGEVDETAVKDNGDGTKTATVPIYAKNIGNGISTVQFNYDMDASFKVDRVNKGSVECQWTPGTESKTLQFLTGDGCNIKSEGVIGKIKIILPADTPDGVYPIKISNFEGSTYDAAADKQIPLENDAFYGVAGKIVLGEADVNPTEAPTDKPTEAPTDKPTEKPTDTPIVVDPTDTPSNPIDQPGGESQVPGGIKALKLDAGKYEVNAGEEFQLKIKVTDNAEGFNTLLTMLEFNNDIFEVGDHVAGDADDPENQDSDIYNSAFEFNLETKDAAKSKLITLMSSSSNVKGDLVFYTLTVKVKEGVKDGYYAIPFDIIGDGEDNAKANRIVTKDGERVPVILNPSYLGAVVKVGNPVSVEPTEAPTDKPTEAPTDKPTDKPTEVPTDKPTETPTDKPTQEPPVSKAVQIVLDEPTYKTNEDGSITVTMPVLAKNIGNGISTVQFDYEMDDTFVIDRVNKGDFECQWTPGSQNKTLQFLTGDGCNIPKEGIIGKIKITVPAGTPDGKYPVKISNFSGSTYDKAADRQIPLENGDFEGVDGMIVIGNPTDEPTEAPTDKPTETPTEKPTEAPTDKPTEAPTDKPTEAPTDKPTEAPTDKPTETPTDKPTSEPGEAVKGDVDGNGVVNTRDFIKLKRYLLLAADKSEVPNGDINGDKAINTIDLIHLVKMILG